MEEKEQVYLDYGSNKIDQNQFFTRAADNVSEWVNSQAWSSKRKEKFLNAYQDLMSKGIAGASNTSGQWELNLKNDIDLDSLSKKDQEMYHEAAYYILQQMKGISPAKTEEQKKEELPIFDNNYFTQQFQGYMGNQRFGGQNFTTSQWNDIDPLDSTTGMRGTTNRANALADLLEGYSNTLQDGKYNFENTAYTDLNDLKSRISTAVQALRDGTWDQNDVDALNRLGINPETYLSTGANEQVQLQDGTTMTRQQYVDALNEQKQKEEEAAQLKQQQEEQAKINANAGVLHKMDGIFGHEAKTDTQHYTEWLASQVGTGQEGYNNVNNTVQSLLEKGYQQGLNQAEKKQLGNLLYHIRNNNPTYMGVGYGQKTGITQDEFNELKLHKNLNSQNINDYMRLPWQTSDGRNIYADNKGSIYYLKPKNHRQLQTLQLDRSKLNNYRQNYLKGATDEGKRELAGQRKLFTGDLRDLTADSARALATLEDVGSAVAAFIPGYGTLASGVLSADAVRNDLIADIADKSVSWGDTAKHAGLNVALGTLGLIPGAKIFTNSAKWVKNLAKWAPTALSTLTAAGTALSGHKEMIDAWKKIASGKELNVEDWKNIALSVRLVSGAFVTGKAAHNTYKYGKLDTKSVSGKKVATTKDGKASEVKLSNEEFNTLKSKKTKAEADSYLESIGHKGHQVSEFNEGKLAKLGVTKRVKGTDYTENVPTTVAQKYLAKKYELQDAKVKQNVLDGKGIYRVLPKTIREGIVKNLPTNRDIYAPKTLGEVRMAATQDQSQQQQSTPQTISQPQQLPPKTPHISPKDFGLPKNTNLNNWYNNRINTKNINRGGKAINKNQDYNATVNFTPNGEKLNIKISNGELVISNGSNVIKQQKLDPNNYTQDAKKAIATTIQKQREQLISDRKIRRQFTKEFIQSIKDLKKQGLVFKQGGNLNLTIAEFLNKQK